MTARNTRPAMTAPAIAPGLTVFEEPEEESDTGTHVTVAQASQELDESEGRAALSTDKRYRNKMNVLGGNDALLVGLASAGGKSWWTGLAAGKNNMVKRIHGDDCFRC
jgi:hypothetical protein